MGKISLHITATAPGEQNLINYKPWVYFLEGFNCIESVEWKPELCVPVWYFGNN